MKKACWILAISVGILAVGLLVYLEWHQLALLAQWMGNNKFINSNFVTAILGSLAGAFAGAYGAQRIAERAKFRDQLLKEMRVTNTVITLSFGIANSLLALKKQHVMPLIKDFDTEKAAFFEFDTKFKQGLISRTSEYHFRANLMSLSLQHLPVDILQKEIFEKLSLSGRPISLATTLSQTLHNLQSSLAGRNQQIESYKANGITAEKYFGLPNNGQVDEMYSSLMKAIYMQTDEGIFYSHLLCQDMNKHGKDLLKRFNKHFKNGAPTISNVDFSASEIEGLMPDAKNFSDWFTAFREKDVAN